MTGTEKLYEFIAKDLTSEISEDEKVLLEGSLHTQPEQKQLFDIIKHFWQLYFPKVSNNKIIEKTEKKLGYTYQQKSKSNKGFKFNVAATVLFILSLGLFGFYYVAQNKPNHSVISEYRSGPNEVKDIVLSDGTKVWLNASSSLFAIEPFRGDCREVRLIGEGYFEVAHNPEKPFMVRTPGLTTKVLGTHFNIISFPKEAKHEISLYKGKVELIDDNNEKNNVVINSGEQALFSTQESRFLVIEKELGQPAAWRGGMIEFYDEQLENIVRTLERKFQTRILIKDKKAGKLRYSASFEEESLHEILHLLNEAHEFEFYETASGIIIESL